MKILSSRTPYRTLLWIFTGSLLIATSLASTPQSPPADIDISSYYTSDWLTGEYYNGSTIAVAPNDGNTNTGITFANWDGKLVSVGPDAASKSLTLNISPTLVPAQPCIRALLNTFYGVLGRVNAILVFKNNEGMAASYSLVGGQTVRDYNENRYTDDLKIPRSAEKAVYSSEALPSLQGS
jgi:hypothetical protein